MIESFFMAAARPWKIEKEIERKFLLKNCSGICKDFITRA